MEISKGSFKENYQGILAIVDEHWEEAGSNKNVRKMDIAYDSFIDLDNKGMLFCLFCKDDNGVVVGYSINFLTTSTHSTKTLMGVNDALFLKKEFRKGGLGKRLMLASEAEAKEQGAELFIWHAKEGSRLSRYLEISGYDISDISYSKEL